MDELLANLNTDAPMFDTPSVLGPAFDMDSGFMADHTDAVSLYAATDMPPTTSPTAASLQPPTPSPQIPIPTAPAQQPDIEMDYLAVDPVSATASTPTPSPAVDITSTNPKSSPTKQQLASQPTSTSLPQNSLQPTSRQPQKPSPQPAPTLLPPPFLPPSPEDAETARLRPVATEIVSESWRLSRNPAQFIRAVRDRLPQRPHHVLPKSIVEESSSPYLSAPTTSRSTPPSENPPQLLWQLPPSSEGAILDALFAKLVSASATSTRLMYYLSYSLVTGIVSQRAVMATCLKWISSTPTIQPRVRQSFANLLLQIIPHYRFSQTDSSLSTEVNQFLAAFAMVLHCVAEAPSLAPNLVTVLSDDRVVALVRACARRMPAVWPRIDASIKMLEAPPPNQDAFADTIAPRSAYAIAPALPSLILRLKMGLSVGITSLESIAASIGNINVPDTDATIPIALQTAFAVTLQVFGTEIAKSLRDLWSQREALGGDYRLLVNLERAAKGSTSGQSQSSAPKYGFKNKVLACEAIVRFLAKRSSVPGASEKWKGLWGGKERLKRIIRDAIPQVKTEIRSESGALLVSMAVTCCAAMCLGPALRMNDANDGVDLLDPAEVSLQETQNEEVEESMGELMGFAVGSLEDAAVAEEIPSWRSFGLWLLLLMSRSGSMLRASGCEHVRAAKVLRTWGGMPTGTPGSHTAHASSHKHSSQSASGHQHAQGSSSSWALTEGVTMFASPASLAIIDVSDVSGGDETIRALCNDLVQ